MYTRYFLCLTLLTAFRADKVPSHHSRRLLDTTWIFWQPFIAFAHRAGPSELLVSLRRVVALGSSTSFCEGLALNVILLWIGPHLALCLQWGCNFSGQILLDLFHWHTSTERSQWPLGLPRQICISFASCFWGQFAICKGEQSLLGERKIPKESSWGPESWSEQYLVWQSRLLVLCMRSQYVEAAFGEYFCLVGFFFFLSVSQINAGDFTKKGNSHFQLCCMMSLPVNHRWRGMVSTPLGSCDQMTMIGGGGTRKTKTRRHTCMKQFVT